ncbi:MAG: competence/damage-inducible protein A [Bacteroidales bacterium]|nr:competence/damage-inducible protein A [Bacteroidales bacterium]
MQAEIITIGDELLLGMTVDTNSSFIATMLTEAGFTIYQITSISDSREHILKTIDEAFTRSDFVIVTGGLGPTSDDITKETIADYFNSSLVSDAATLEKISSMLKSRGLEMNENNRKQALVPDKCKVLSNERGTAPGMLFEKEGHSLVSMPGVPYEMKYIMETHIIPYIKHHFRKETIVYRTVMTYGTFEARLAEILEQFEEELSADVRLAYLPTAGIIKLRLTAGGEKREEALEKINRQIKKLQGIIPQYIYGYDGITLEETVGDLLESKSLTLGIAESCTGGRISGMITSVPGSSKYFKGAVIAYDNVVKIRELGVESAVLEKEGAVSKSIAAAMAEGVMQRLGTDFGVGTTGIAGPGGGTPEKPVGTVWIAVASAAGTVTGKFGFGMNRESNIRRASLAALNMLREQIISS